MKKRFFLAITIFALAFATNAQNDTMFSMKNEAVVGKYNINTQDDGATPYLPKTLQTCDTFIDSRDGNVYTAIQIGNQCWMAENLKYLPSVVGPATESQTTPYYYVYGYDSTSVTAAKATVNYTTYGVLYNWPAAMAGSSSSSSNPSGVQGVCPTGWHLPGDAEWTELTDFVGIDAGTKLKSTSGWYNNGNGTDHYGFTALPGGDRGSDGTFYVIEHYGHWWSAAEGSATVAWYRRMSYSDSDVGRGSISKEFGFSVRCIYDSEINVNVQESNEYKKIQIYPNPATDKIIINSAETQNAMMQIYDMVGKCVLTSNIKEGTNDIKVSMLPEGIYVVHVSDDNQTYQVKLIKE